MGCSLLVAREREREREREWSRHCFGLFSFGGEGERESGADIVLGCSLLVAREREREREREEQTLPGLFFFGGLRESGADTALG